MVGESWPRFTERARDAIDAPDSAGSNLPLRLCAVPEPTTVRPLPSDPASALNTVLMSAKSCGLSDQSSSATEANFGSSNSARNALPFQRRWPTASSAEVTPLRFTSSQSAARRSARAVGVLAVAKSSFAASTGFGLLASTFTRSQISAMFVTIIGTLIPSVQFAGLINPVSSLEGMGAFIGRIYPATHFLTISRGVFSKALDLSSLLPSFWPLLVAAPVIVGMAIALLRKQES